MAFRFLFLLVIPFLSGCSLTGQYIDIGFDREIIPEGIAIDPGTGRIFLSSIHKQKIITYDPANREGRDFIASQEYGYKRGIGILIINNTLFALGSEPEQGIWHSVLLTFDLESNQLLHRFQINDTLSRLMNDLAVSKSNEVFITDTERHLVYRLEYPEGHIEPFLEHEEIKYPNGIAISEDGTRLFIDSWTSGIRIVDIASKKILNPVHPPTSKFGIDGLKYYQGHLYAIRNSGKDKSKHGLYRIRLSDDESSINDVVPLLTGHPKMNMPTTFCIQNDTAYILANSQLGNLDQDTNTILYPDSLTNTFILPIKLN
ncbi:MAG TPA: SMP-30/gluconolactonase/LRE family protein [Eudoraea sp.]|nr:SMP-30/gluconolactonase/LRE family protein [Eudoraea sp.]